MGVVDLFNQIVENKFGFFQQVKVVADVMTPDPQTVTLDDTLRSVKEFMRLNRVHHAPVIDPDSSTVVGIVSDRDVVRQYPYTLGTGAQGDHDEDALRTTVARFVTRNPIWCAEDESPVSVLTLMLDHHIDSVLVGDATRLDGIVTPRDFIRTLMLYHQVCTRDTGLRRLRLVDLDVTHGMPLDEIFATGAQTVRDVMTKRVQAINVNDPVARAIQLMQDLEIRHLPVLSDESELVGILSDRELLSRLPVCEKPPQAAVGFREALFANDDTEFQQLCVKEVMDEDFRPATSDMLLADVMKRFFDETLSGLPVVDGSSNEVCGIVTTSDILRVFRVVLQIGSLSTPQRLPADNQEALPTV